MIKIERKGKAFDIYKYERVVGRVCFKNGKLIWIFGGEGISDRTVKYLIEEYNHKLDCEVKLLYI